MNKDNFKLTNKDYFKIESRKLLIADPYYLGYNEKVNDLINKAYPSPLAFFKYGFLFHNEDESGAGSDGYYVVSRKGNGIALEDKEVFKKKFGIKGGYFGDYNKFDNKIKNFYEKKGREYFFTASLDICLLLIGDYDKFYENEENRKINIENHWRKFYEGEKRRGLKIDIEKQIAGATEYNTNSINESYKQVINVIKGNYKATYNPRKGLLKIEKT